MLLKPPLASHVCRSHKINRWAVAKFSLLRSEHAHIQDLYRSDAGRIASKVNFPSMRHAHYFITVWVFHSLRHKACLAGLNRIAVGAVRLAGPWIRVRVQGLLHSQQVEQAVSMKNHVNQMYQDPALSVFLPFLVFFFFSLSLSQKIFLMGSLQFPGQWNSRELLWLPMKISTQCFWILIVAKILHQMWMPLN